MGIYVFQADDARRFAREQGIRTYERGDELHLQTCPYCHGGASGKDKRTCAINLTTGRFQCMRASCGMKGNMITLARDFNFSLGRDVDEYYCRKERYKNMRKYPRPVSKAPAVAYMETRGISRAVTEAYAITTQRGKDDILAFPFFDENGAMTFAKYRKTDFDPSKDNSKEWCEANCKPILFGMDKCSPEVSDTLVMTEGQIDSLSCAEAGIPNAVSVPGGKNNFRWVPYCWDFMSKYKTLIIFGDHEHGEITLLDEMKKRFHGTVKHVRPEDYRGCKDANELLQKHGAQAVRDAVAHAVPPKHSQIIRMADVKRKSLADIPYCDSGIAPLDQLIGGVYYGQLVILTGERGKGKSTLGGQFILQAMEQGEKCFLYSGEMPNWAAQDWIDRQAAGRNHISVRRQKNASIVYSVDVEAVWPIHTWYYDLLYLRDAESLALADDSEETEALIDVIRDAIVQYGCRVVLIDNLLTAMEDDMVADYYRQQTVFVRKLAQMAQAYDAIIYLVAHPRKSNADTFRNDDVSGSGNITNLASLVLQYAEPKEVDQGKKGKKAKDDGDDDDGKDSTEKGDRVLRVTKNRFTGRTDFDGIPLWFEESSKRISAKKGEFSWKYKWEFTELMEIHDDSELPFGENGEDL